MVRRFVFCGFPWKNSYWQRSSDWQRSFDCRHDMENEVLLNNLLNNVRDVGVQVLKRKNSFVFSARGAEKICSGVPISSGTPPSMNIT